MGVFGSKPTWDIAIGFKQLGRWSWVDGCAPYPGSRSASSRIAICHRLTMISTPRAGDNASGSGAGNKMAVVGLGCQVAKVMWDYVAQKVDGKEAARRLGRATAGALGGMAINFGVSALAQAVGKATTHPVGQFACTVTGNLLGSWLADKFMQFLEYLFADDPAEGYRRACAELGVAEDAHRLEIKRTYAKCHPDKDSGLTNDQFERKTCAFELIRAFRSQNNTWDDANE